VNDWKEELDAKAQQAQDIAEKADPFVMLDRINAAPQWRYTIHRVSADCVVVEVLSVAAFDDASAIRIAKELSDMPGIGMLLIESKKFEAPE